MKKLTNKEIKDRCSYIELKTDPFEIDKDQNIWITAKVLSDIFKKHITWVYNTAKKNYFSRKKSKGQWLYRYQDFYDLIESKRIEKQVTQFEPNMEYFYCNHCGFEAFNVYIDYSWTDASGDLFSCPQCGKNSFNFTRIDEEMYELNKL